MKKIYFAPKMEIVELATSRTQLLAGSGVYSSMGIEYGGIDEEGNLIPE